MEQGRGTGLEAWSPTQTPPPFFSEPMQKIGIGELITRSAKHIFKTYLQVLPLPPARLREVSGEPGW